MAPGNIISTPLLRDTTLFWLSLAALDLQYHLYFAGSTVITSLFAASIESLACTAIFFVGKLGNLTQVTLAYLSAPYFIFLPFWLKTPIAIIVTILFSLAVYHAWRRERKQGAAVPPYNGASRREIIAFLGILLWVHLSGAGGYGYQVSDYGMHNGRLQDLINYSWPVRYEKNINLIYYIGYYLPSAAIGKLFGFDVAIRSVFSWTVFGVTLTVRWLCKLTGCHFSILLLALFVLFGPQDLVGFVLSHFYYAKPSHDIGQWSFWNDTDKINFWASYPLQKFIGNFLSNTFQLYWAPHQIVAGWLCAAFVMQCLLRKNNQLLIFSYALLCLWSPITMLAFLPTIGAVLYYGGGRNIFRIRCYPDIFAGLILIPLFLSFYFGGSALHNPRQWTLSVVDHSNWPWFFFFHLLTWGLYAMVCLPGISKEGGSNKVFPIWIFANFSILSLLIYGEWSDLICRGSAPLMFCLCAIVIRELQRYLADKKLLLFFVTGLCLLVGSFSALLQIGLAVDRYGELQSPIQGNKYSLAYQFVGPDNSIFGRYLRKNP